VFGDSEPKDWIVTKDNYIKVLEVLRLDAPDIRSEIKKDLEDGRYPYLRLKATLEPICMLAGE